MTLFLEYCFYVGVILFAIGAVWLVWTLVQGRGRKAFLPIACLLLGVAFVFGPGIVTRSLVVDLGPRERIVENERHLSLTGWDGESYQFLVEKQDTTVLQMGNTDVNDETLAYLVGHSELRELDLNDSQVTDSGLPHISNLPKLQTLRLRGTQITDAGFRQHLMPNPTLQQIDLRETRVSPELVEQWKAADPNRRAFR